MEVLASVTVHSFINSVGADAGFAAFIAVALMALLYFAQARETASLRERLDEAHDRIGGLEARIAQLMQLQSSRRPVGVPVAQAPTAPVPVVPPPGARPMGSAVAAVRRIPAATPAVAGAPGPSAGRLPVAPVGMAAPALASATKLIPDPVSSPAAEQDTALATAAAATVAGATVAAGNGQAPATAPPVPRPPAATPPRVQIRSDGSGSAGPIPRRTAPPITGRPQSQRARAADQSFNLLDDDRGARRGLSARLAGRMLPLGIAVVAVVVIAVGLYVITSNNGAVTSSGVKHSAGGSHAAGSGKSTASKGKSTKAPPFSPSSVTVAVLNGTDVAGLAADVGKALDGDGYHKGSITNAASQSQTTTVVYYRPSYRAAAQQVAKSLKLGRNPRLARAGHLALHACATTPTGAAGSCSGDVIVSVGQDLAGMATGGSSSAG